MPCRSDYMEPSPRELAAAKEAREQLQKIADDAVASTDMLREYILGNVAAEKILGLMNKELVEKFSNLKELNSKLYVQVKAEYFATTEDLILEYEDTCDWVNDKARGKPLPARTMKYVEKQQIEHRKKDLARLLKTLGEAGDVERLRKVIDADPTKPLGPQLGFEPDEF